jgi:hypothetical protein
MANAGLPFGGENSIQTQLYELHDCFRGIFPIPLTYIRLPFYSTVQKNEAATNGRREACCANSVDNATDFGREKTVPKQLSDENASEQRMLLSCGSKCGFKDGTPAFAPRARFSGA